jgi:nodulation protein E
MRRVVVTGRGCVSGLGQGVAESWRRALGGRGGIRSMVLSDDADKDSWRAEGPAAPIEAFDMTALEARFGTKALAQTDPLARFAIAATLEAVEDANLSGDPVLGERTGVLIGCGSAGNATIDAAYRRLYAQGLPKVHPQTIPSSMISAPASQIAMLFGIHGPTFVLASACASSAHAIGEAMYMIRSGRVDVAIAGGSEACLTLGSWVAWKSLGVLATETCRPFSSGRDGMVLGEGAAVLVLEERDRAMARGATIYGELTGYGASSDAMHITMPDASGIQAAIRAAHADAGLAVEEPVLISSHGTGTPLNDKAEAAALNAVYGDALSNNVVIATKSAHGHLIGGTGALELLIGLEALNAGVAPPVLNHLARDPECLVPLALEPTPITHNHLVSNSFAFGGLNAVLIARKAA